jgi:hypothetical protein
MSKVSTTSAAPFEMFITISREDAPRLYDDLVGLPKGRRRINRFRFLANQGLIAEVLTTLLTGKAAGHKGSSLPTPLPDVLAFMRSMDLSLEEERDGE